jgi:hypothetical protein
MSPTPRSCPDISPELVLVDPELRRVALLLLPDPGSFALVSQPKPVAVDELPERVQPAVARRSRVRTWSRRALVMTGAAGLFAVSWPSAVGLRTPPGPRLVSVDSAAPAAPRVESARAESLALRELVDRRVATVPRVRPPGTVGARRAETPKARPVGKRPRSQSAPAAKSPEPAPSPVPVRRTRRERASLAWKAVGGASYYNVIVWRKGRRVLDLWPSRNRALLPASWTYEGARRTLAPGRYLWFVYPGFGPRAAAQYGKPVQSGILVVDRK